MKIKHDLDLTFTSSPKKEDMPRLSKMIRDVGMQQLLSYILRDFMPSGKLYINDHGQVDSSFWLGYYAGGFDFMRSLIAVTEESNSMPSELKITYDGKTLPIEE